jgi:integrase
MRRSEVTNLKQECIQGDAICLPSTETKNKRIFIFPIGRLASCILTTPAASCAIYLFPAHGKTSSSFNGFSKAKAQLDGRANINAWTLHDLRRAYAINLQRLGVKLEVIENLLNPYQEHAQALSASINAHACEAEMREAAHAYEAWLIENIVPSSAHHRM